MGLTALIKTEARQVMNNENTWTQGRECYTLGSIGGNRGGTVGGS